MLYFFISTPSRDIFTGKMNVLLKDIYAVYIYIYIYMCIRFFCFVFVIKTYINFYKNSLHAVLMAVKIQKDSEDSLMMITSSQTAKLK